jgi:hypothetical protein
MIKSLSPYYVSTPWVNHLGGAVLGESYTLSIFVWNGAKAAVPAATYTITKQNPEDLITTDKVNIARLISDYIEFAPQGAAASGVIDSNNTWWVQTSVVYENDATVQQAAIDLFSLGYSYGMEGENVTTITSDILLTSPQDYKVNRSGVFVMPVLLDEITADVYSIKSYPDLEINITTTVIPNTTVSGELVSYIWVQLDETTTDTYVEVVYNTVTTTLLITEECKYTPVDIFFQNKEGHEQVLTFFKERKDSLSVSNEQYESDRGQPSAGNHQFDRFNVQGMSAFTLSSGFVAEEMNDTFTQLLLSERIWSYDGTTFTPLNIKSKSLEYKTRQKQRLINYSINFENSFNQINNI